jgi:V/A-type H+/Na+-transporting ATPase subunit A
MDRTIIICNTSSMPVAATRSIDLHGASPSASTTARWATTCCCIADSTSRWAQAMRETSGPHGGDSRRGGVPGLPRFFHQERLRAGRADPQSRGLHTGSLTMIGTVSPAGGNFEEPVTQPPWARSRPSSGCLPNAPTSASIPAIDPLLSWSRYREQLAAWFCPATVDPQWSARIAR